MAVKLFRFIDIIVLGKTICFPELDRSSVAVQTQHKNGILPILMKVRIKSETCNFSLGTTETKTDERYLSFNLTLPNM